MRRPRLVLASLACATTIATSSLVPAPVLAGDRAAFLGFEGNQADAAKELATALAAELRERGHVGDKQMSLVELRLTMGCEQGDDACVAEGGRTMEADAVVFGVVSGGGKNFSVELSLMDVESGKVTKKTASAIAAEDLRGAPAEALAVRLVDELYGGAEPGTAPVPTETPPEGEPVPTAEAPADEDKGELVWGKYKPRKKWKPIGLGISAGLAIASLGTAIGTTVAISPNGPLKKKLVSAAEDSLTDENPGNDIDPNTEEDLCAAARVMPDPGEVVNLEMYDICKQADALATTATVTWITTGVFAASTLVFTILMFVHRKEPGAAALRRHDVQLGAAPTLTGGFGLSGSVRF